jgi:alpha-N-arabinofuranosidase
MKYHLYPILLASVCLSLSAAATAAEFHVATAGSDANDGTPTNPLKSISAAALKAMPGDTITVHAGIYREHVNPPRGGTSETMRITYQAASGETVTITGSEPAKGWVKAAGDTWKLTLPNSFFGIFNPFAERVHGDWFSPQGRVHHRGCVYLGKDWLTEAANLDAVMKPAAQTPLWFAQVDGVGGDVPTSPTAQNTVIHAQFPGVNPNEAAVEISVRPTVFTPEKTNMDYITVRGFDLRNAATNWAAPTAGQVGLVTAYWCKGWIIENNEISNSRCCGIALGKYSDQWDGKRGNTEGYYLTIDDALKKDGWTKEKIGGHLVRNNHIHHCGQTGIVGSLGCAFSRIEGNEIHEINMQGIWGGAEMAGIKFHGALDTVITGNHIYRCGHAGGLWLDWMAQGTLVTNNLFHDNPVRDIFTEVNHGPFLIANNIMLSPSAYFANSQGGAYAHNLMVGNLKIVADRRRTPFHKPHSTELLDMRDCPIGDARLYNNLLGGRANFNAFDPATLPVTAAGNVFTKGSQPSKFETEALLKPEFDAGVKLTQKADGWYLEINTDRKWASEQKRRLVTTALLGKAIIPNQEFTNPDGSPLTIDTDYFGNPRDAANPFPGPFETTADGPREIKVWPKAASSSR